MKLCSGATSIGQICADESIDASFKNSSTCYSRCSKETDSNKIACWQTHTAFAEAQGASTHCPHAAGQAPCLPWPL
jgi:hypothetical protein